MNSIYDDVLIGAELTAINLIESQVSRHADKPVYEYLRNGETVDGSLTFSQLHDKARSLAVRIEEHCEPGDRVLLLFPSGLNYIVSFFAVLYAGCVAVPAYPPQNQRRDWDRLLRILHDCDPTLVLSGVDGIETWLDKQALATPAFVMKVEHTSEDLIGLETQWQRPSIDADDLAFLQYSSGSTGAPKGVMVTHRNMLHNQYVIQNCSQKMGPLRFVGWLPIYHDMGLIGNIIQPLYSASTLSLMAPAHVIQKPFRWLKAISDKRAHVSGGPNFIYDLCVDKISSEQKAQLDLSHWEVAFNGAEPISVHTMRRFADAFAECGFQYKAFMPCYGLAENTLMVSSILTEESPKVVEVKLRELEESRIVLSSIDSKANDLSKSDVACLVSSGNSIVGQTVRVVNPNSFEACDERHVGEVWVSGDSVAKGYWNQPELTNDNFKQRIKPVVDDKVDAKQYMRTGDLGFFDEGHLYITGRMKDLIIIRGQNHYPQDIEASIQGVSTHFRNSATAAFSVDVDGKERLVVVQELMPRSARKVDELLGAKADNDLIKSIRNAVVERHQLELYDFVAIKFGTLSRTTSGKIQRFRNRQRYLEGGIDAAYSSLENTSVINANRPYIAPSSDNEIRLASLWEQLLKVDRVSLDDNFFELGGHSLMLMQLIGALNEQGFEVSAKDVFNASSIAELAKCLDDKPLATKPFSSLKSLASAACVPQECEQLQSSMFPLLNLNDAQLRWLESQIPNGAQNVQDAYPLASLQEGIFFHNRLNTEHDPYVMYRLFSVNNARSLESFVESLNFVIQRHDALRTAIIWEGLDDPVQVVLRKIQLGVDTNHFDSEAAAKAASSALCASVAKTIDITQAPLIALKVFSNAETEKSFAVVQLHHIVVDNQCLAILERDMAAFQAGVEGQLPATIPYQRFIAFNQHEVASQQSAKLFFEQMLIDVDEPTLPLNLQGIKSHGVDVSQARAEIPKALNDTIRTTARQLKISPATLFHAAWAMVVSAYSGRDNVVFGTVLSGRLQGVSGSENMLGVFINTLPVRIGLDDEASKVLSSVHLQLCELINHEQYPLVAAQACSQLDPNSPLFSAVLNYRHSGNSVSERKQALADDGIQFLKLNERTNYPFTLSVDDFETGFDLLVQIDQEGQADAVLQCVQHAIAIIVDSACNKRNERLCDLSVIPASQLEANIESWLNTQQPFEDSKCIHELFEAQVLISPDAKALVLDNTHLTYAELNERANKVAHYLLETHSVSKDQLIGLCFERTFELFIAILGVLKAGAAYVPLDPDAPTLRLDTIISDSDLTVLLTVKSVSGIFNNDNAGFDTVILDDSSVVDELSSFDKHNITSAELGLHPENLAYVIYTSGSTGTPKGVALEHKGLANLSAAQQTGLTVTNNSRVLQFASSAFDAATWEWCMALTNGATLVLANKELIKDPIQLSDYVQQQGVTHATLPPAVLPSLTLERWNTVKTLIVAGDTCPISHAARWAKDRTFINAYGPSETTVCATMGEFNSQLNCTEQESVLAIGQPLQNTQIYILNQHLKSAPRGAIGELFVGGVGIARGYINRETLNQESFIENPFYQESSYHSSKRLYRTGDLVRSDLNGSIEFIGRADHQVKIRGFRVELGEIDRALSNQDGVAEALVLANKAPNNDIKLTAYVVPDFKALGNADLVEELAANQVHDWAGAFEQTYEQTDSNKSFVIDGWTNSYTREPISAVEMKDWLACTTERITKLKPKSVLEIGCGAGLILQGIAPLVDKYTATDLSQNTIDNLASAIAASSLKDCNIELYQSEAQNFSMLAATLYDTVIINSVAQYFPNIDYLLEVISRAVASMSSGGKLFIGDVRHLDLLNVFHSSVLRYQLKSSTTRYEFLDQVQHNIDREHELAVSPNWFQGLSKQLGNIESIQILPKIDSATNELSSFRYDVVISLVSNNNDQVKLVDEQVEWLDCRSLMSMSDCDAALKMLENDENQNSVIGLRSLVNPRVNVDSVILNTLLHDSNNRNSTISSIESDVVNQVSQSSGISAANLSSYCKDKGYQLTLSWLPVSSNGAYHALISRGDNSPHYDWSQLNTLDASNEPAFANNPLKARLIQRLPNRLKSALQATLPNYMQPSECLLLAAMPLNINGKIDRKVLASIDLQRSHNHVNDHSYIAPNTEQERAMCEIWQGVLELKRVGLNDNFFELGGHSLLATRLVAQINLRFGVHFLVKQAFESPTVASMVASLSSLTVQKSVPTIERIDRNETLPLSFAQQRLWLLSHIDDDPRPYLMPGAFHLSGTLMLDALKLAFEKLVTRHESLRTCFVSQENGDPEQIILAGTEFNLGLIDLSLLDNHEQQLQLNSGLLKESSRGFDISNDIMIRVTVFKLSNQKHVLSVVMHHIAADGWSLPILLNEISTHYQSLLKSSASDSSSTKNSELPELPIQYADYAHWQRQWLRGDELERHLNYWQERLSNIPVLHSLPLDFSRPSKQTFNGSIVQSTLSPHITSLLRSTCKQANATLFMGLHTAFSVLLARYSGESDIVIGSPVANREQVEVENLIGFFVNMLVLRSDVSGEPTFLELLSQSRSHLLDAYAHQQVPFEQLVDVLQPQRTMSHSPLFQVMLNLLSPEKNTRPSLSGLDVDAVEINSNISKYDLTLQVQEVGEELALSWEYNTDLFKASSIQRLADCFNNLISSMLAQPASNVHRLEILNQGEHDLLIKEWNDTSVEWPDSDVEELFVQQASLSKDKTAVIFGEQSLSYSELDILSNQLAHSLQAKGVGPKSLVGIAQQRSLSMLVSLLGVMKAGAAYVPIDPNYPKDRVRFMLADADLSVVLADQAVLDSDLLDEIKTDTIQIINVDKQEEVSDDFGKRPGNNAYSSDLAYVIYTSGSTGKPKGVEVTRANLSNFIFSMRDLLTTSEGDHLLAVTSLSFDIAALELYLPLICGAQVTIADELLSMDGARLKNHIETSLESDSPITIMQATPVTWKLLLSAGWCHKTPFTVLCGGEAFPRDLANDLKNDANDQTINVWNLYGPTETTIWSTAFQLKNRSDAIADCVPIGRPISNTQTFILDQYHNPVPIGAKGELFIGGAGVVQGYLGNSKLTKERFINSPYGRLYQTGDLARYRSDGILECLGRLDSQVKVRGYRIELEEVETCIRQDSSIADVAVSIFNSNGEDLLAAYVVLNAEPANDDWPASLKQSLNNTLPVYMHPAIIVTLDTLPLTPNGKIDRKALPDPEFSSQQATYLSPTTDTEIELSQIWQDLLNIEKAGVNDNFFMLGGHSLLATQLLSRINQAFKIDLPLKSLFGLNTLSELADAIDQQQPQMSDESFTRMDNLLAELELSDDLQI